MVTAPYAKKRRHDAHESQDPKEIIGPSPYQIHHPTSSPSTTTESEEKHIQESPSPTRQFEGEKGINCINGLPEAIIGDIISILPIKDGARTQILSSQWCDLWISSPLNLDYTSLPSNEEVQAGLISKIIATHKGSVRRLVVPILHLHHRRHTLNKWLKSSALDNLQEIEFDASRLIYKERPHPLLSCHVFRFSPTLHITTISECQMPDPVESFNFPQLRQLGLENVMISNESLNSLIAGSPLLESLLLKNCYGLVDSVLINLSSLKSIGFSLKCRKLVIEDAPMLERLLQLENSDVGILMVLSAPKLEMLGCISDSSISDKLVFGTMIVKELDVVSFAMVGYCSVKILAISICNLSLDMVIRFMRYFPCMEKLYIQISNFHEGNNIWPYEHHGLIKCLDISLKTVVLKNYRGTTSQVTFASFFIMNAKMLESMRFEGIANNDKKQLAAMQQRLLQLKKKASSGAHFYFTTSSCHHYLPHIKHVRDLSKGDPFGCTCLDEA